MLKEYNIIISHSRSCYYEIGTMFCLVHIIRYWCLGILYLYNLAVFLFQAKMGPTKKKSEQTVKTSERVQSESDITALRDRHQETPPCGKCVSEGNMNQWFVVFARLQNDNRPAQEAHVVPIEALTHMDGASRAYTANDVSAHKEFALGMMVLKNVLLLCRC